MKLISIFLFIFVLTHQLFAQNLGEGYTTLRVIQAKDLIVGSPTDVLFTQDMKYMIISYDAKPTYLAVYETATWKRVNQIEIPGNLYLGQSFMDCNDDQILYGDYGTNDSKFYQIDILSDDREKVRNKDIPDSFCGHVFKGKAQLREQTFRVKDKFIVIVNNRKKLVTVFAKKTKRT